MPLNISTEAIAEKNKLGSSSPWLLLLAIAYPGEEVIRVVWNTESIIWNGHTWHPAAFELGELEESSEGEIPTVDLRVNDIERRITPHLDDYDGGVGAEATIYVVHADHLDHTEAEIEEDFELLDVGIDYLNTIKIRLGSENLTNRRSPPHRYLKGHCRYQEFKGTLCGYSGAETECDRTFERCRELGNSTRFGGFPGIGKRGYFEA